MKNVGIAFYFSDSGQALTGYQKTWLRMIFDIKLDETRKARLVANGNETEEPKEYVFSLVVSRDSVKIFFTLAG